ncbi:hypothetical protein LSM04_004460 [Trypanosoma melophagium]|uniref:uncharacterized protein n=1 Tax=Trypanosoma melophagium TaxID=715481 RepID=UPI003519F192|nr:hypothetical protein LSM04_004460 [Trypanosoma melophagium]
MGRITSSEHFENTSILILSTDSLLLTGDELQEPGISFDNGADSFIVLDTDGECDEELLFITDDNITMTITPDDSDKRKKTLLEKKKQVIKLNPENENVCEKSSYPDVVLVPPIIGIPLKKNENSLQRNIVESLHQRLSPPHNNKDDEKSPDVPQQVSPEAEKLIFKSTESVGMPAEKRPSAQRDLHPSRSFERYVQEDRAKRQLQEVLAEQQRQREEQEIQFTPQVSSYAAQHDGAEMTGECNGKIATTRRRTGTANAEIARKLRTDISAGDYTGSAAAETRNGQL